MIPLVLYPAEIDRITDALEILANNYNTANMIRAREKCLELRSKIIQQQLEGPPSSEGESLGHDR